jgi:hypothetical protein
MYLVSYELKKDILSKELLEILDMYEWYINYWFSNILFHF